MPSPRRRSISRSCARRGEDGVRDIRLHVPDQADVVTELSTSSPHASHDATLADEHVVFDLTPDEWTAVALSLRIAVVATVVSLPFGIAVAWLLARKDFWGKALLDGVVHLPLVLPPVVTGYLLLITFGRQGRGRRLPRRPFRHRVLVPLDRRGARLRRDGVSAAGARRSGCRSRRSTAGSRTPPRRSAPTGFWAFLTVTLPLALPGIIAGMVLCFAKALGEFGATITFVSNIPGETQTISAAIYTLHADPRRRRRRGAARHRRHRHRARRAGRVGMVRAPRRHALPRRLTMLVGRRRKAARRIRDRREVRDRRRRRPRCSARPAPARPRSST